MEVCQGTESEVGIRKPRDYGAQKGSLISQLGDQIRIQKHVHKDAIWGPTLLGPQQDPLGPECLADHPKKAIGACWGLIGAPGRPLGHHVPPALSVIQDVLCS